MFPSYVSKLTITSFTLEQRKVIQIFRKLAEITLR